MVRAMETISSVKDLVAAFGGTRAFAMHLGVTAQQVSNMRQANRIPLKHYLAISRALEHVGPVADELFRARSAA